MRRLGACVGSPEGGGMRCAFCRRVQGARMEGAVMMCTARILRIARHVITQGAVLERFPSSALQRPRGGWPQRASSDVPIAPLRGLSPSQADEIAMLRGSLGGRQGHLKRFKHGSSTMVSCLVMGSLHEPGTLFPRAVKPPVKSYHSGMITRFAKHLQGPERRSQKVVS